MSPTPSVRCAKKNCGHLDSDHLYIADRGYYLCRGCVFEPGFWRHWGDRHTFVPPPEVRA